MTELDLIIDLHKTNDRQGPGSEADTLRALSFIATPDNQQLQVADIGCGTGGQSITLATHLNAHITAIDLFPDFLSELDNRAKASEVDGKIETQQQSMDDLTLGKEQLDLIWSEGAIYNIGFENGIKQWKEYLKPSGYLAVSELTWITDTRPQEIEDFWNKEYPEVNTASAKIKQLEDNGYTLVGYFYLSPESWLDNYYAPLQAEFESFLKRNKNTPLAREVVKENEAEIELYRKFKAYFSYGFYIARKN